MSDAVFDDIKHWPFLVEMSHSVALEGWVDCFIWCQNNFESTAWITCEYGVRFRDQESAMLFALRWQA
jgi:hypothetical protein